MKTFYAFMLLLFLPKAFAIEMGVYEDIESNSKYLWVGKEQHLNFLINTQKPRNIDIHYFLDLNYNKLIKKTDLSSFVLSKSLSEQDYLNFIFESGYSFYFEGHAPGFSGNLFNDKIQINLWDSEDLDLSSKVHTVVNKNSEDVISISFYSAEQNLYGFILSSGYLSDCYYDEVPLQSYAVYFVLNETQYNGCVYLKKSNLSYLD